MSERTFLPADFLALGLVSLWAPELTLGLMIVLKKIFCTNWLK